MRTLHAQFSIVLSQHVQQAFAKCSKATCTASPRLLLHQKGVKSVLVPQHLHLQKQICGNTTKKLILLNDAACSN